MYIPSSSSWSAFLAISLGLTIFGEIFAYVTLFFFNPTMEVATFLLRCPESNSSLEAMPAFFQIIIIIIIIIIIAPKGAIREFLQSLHCAAN